MPSSSVFARRGAYAASRQQTAKKNVSYTFASGKPAGLIEDASRSDMLPLVLAGGTRLQEDPASGSTWSPLNWYAGAPVADKMNTRQYRATMIVGNGSAGTNRGALVFVGGTDGAGGDGTRKLLYFRIRGQGGLKAVIESKDGTPDSHTPVNRLTSTTNYLVSANDTIGLEISLSAGIYSYQGLRNGVALADCLWTDTAGDFGVPGYVWGCGGYGQYSGGWFGSLGAYGMSCLDL